MFRSISVVAAVVGLLAVGGLSALAGNAHEAGVSSTTFRSDASSSLASAMGELTSVAARLDESAVPTTTQAQAQTQAQAETDSDTADEDANDVTDENADDDTGEVSAAAPAPAPTTESEQQGAEHDD